ncbi:hypothetical protein XM38_001140 [Halomicronema hongdechloris C2206]|uniref:DUF2281 domain-containing protein n=1 Tax=Halomicronema hongdechloris C2206 TaxID=1641165 RepID=A0A1Z3HFW6_9CYAN|nr:hypothetical protein [Halomicronema hongdechloris]ASC69188.1 hypothetical protein XM38_001140 [Halomicronema hongdechloris C2206]
MSPLLQQILQEIDQLPLDEQMQVLEYAVGKVKRQLLVSELQQRWSDLKGIAPYPLLGEGAQAWVSSTRRGNDSHCSKC